VDSDELVEEIDEQNLLDIRLRLAVKGCATGGADRKGWMVILKCGPTVLVFLAKNKNTKDFLASVRPCYQGVHPTAT